MTPREPQDRARDPRYATITMRSKHWRAMFRAWVESFDVDVEQTDPDAHETPLGSWMGTGEETAEAAAWFREQAETSGLEDLEPLPDGSSDSITSSPGVGPQINPDGSVREP